MREHYRYPPQDEGDLAIIARHCFLFQFFRFDKAVKHFIVNTHCRFPAIRLVRMRYIPTQQPAEAVYKDQQERVDGEESSGSRVIAASDYQYVLTTVPYYTPSLQ